jgi:hypothetical protein
MKPTVLVLPVILVVQVFAAHAEAGSDSLWGGLEAGPHEVGFRILDELDRSRAIRAGDSASTVHPRPIRVYVWYPAKWSDDSKPMTFGRYAEAADADVWSDELLDGIRGRTAYAERPFARSLGRERYEEILGLPVRAAEGAHPAPGKFPLIVVGQGLYYESPVTHAVLGEFLASHGFVVATCPLVGSWSPLVRLDLIDLETQVRDMEFVIARARQESFVSQESLGLFGFDMGGMSAVLLAMRNPDVDAFASVDAGILFGHASAIPSGIPFSSPHFDPALLRSPWLHATQREFASPPPGEEGSSLFDDAVHADRYLVLVDGMRHADFTSYALVQNRAPIRGYWPPEKGQEKETYEALSLYLSNFFRAYLAGAGDSREFLSKDPDQVVPGIELTIEHRAPIPSGPTQADFLNALLAGEVSTAMEMATAIEKRHPDSPHLEETVLIRLGFHLLSSWSMSDEGIAVLRLNTDLHPQSVRTWETLGDGYLWIDDRERAGPCFHKVLELDPENDRARRILDWMEESSDD